MRKRWLAFTATIMLNAISAHQADWSSGPAEFYLVYPSRKFLPTRVKLLVQLQEKWGIRG